MTTDHDNQNLSEDRIRYPASLPEDYYSGYQLPEEIASRLHEMQVKRRRRITQGICLGFVSAIGTLDVLNYIVSWLGRPVGIPVGVAFGLALCYLVVSPFLKD